MTVTSTPLSVRPLSGLSTDADFGAVIENVDLTNLSDNDFAAIHDALYKHSVVVLKNQAACDPKQQYQLTQRFDPSAKGGYGHGKTLDAKRSILHPDLKTVPHQPEVQIIGNGFIPEYEGLQNFQLKHPHHKTFHRDPIPAADDLSHTRFYRWHIDAALYDNLNPPKVTSLLAVSVPKGRRQTLLYDDGTGDVIPNVPLGTTAFVSGYAMYDALSAADKEFVRGSRIEYAPHPYIWMSKAKSRSDGLGLHSEGAELPAEELPAWEEGKVQILPMVWRNPVNGRLALQMHPSAVRKIHLPGGKGVVEDLEEVREIVHRLQRPGIKPDLVYAHDWEEGDLVLFNNQGVLHSVVGAFAEGEVRLFRQCNIAASEPPVGAEGIYV